MKPQEHTDVQEAADFCAWLVRKAEGEFDRLRIIPAIYTEDQWADCRDALAQRLTAEFPHARADSINEVFDSSGSQACVWHPFEGTGGFRTVVMKINLDDCRTGFWPDAVREAQAVTIHEGGHVVGAEGRGGVNSSLFEENTPDVFEVLLKSWLGQREDAEALLQMRVVKPGEASALAVSRRYGFPAVYEEAVALGERYYQRGQAGQGVSLAEMVEAADELVEDRGQTLNQWFGFADAMYALSGETRDPADILGAAVKVGHPHAKIISEASGIAPNLGFMLAHSPNPFLSRNAAFDYPGRPESSGVKPSGDQKGGPYGLGPWPSGFAVLDRETGWQGPYDLDLNQRNYGPFVAPPPEEPHFS